MELAMVAAGFTPGEADRCAARWRRGSAAAASSRSRRAWKSGMKANGYQPVRRCDLPPDPRLRRIRFSRVALGELRAAGLRLLLDQVPSPGGVLRGAAEQPADGLLRAGAARAGCAPPRRRCGRRTCRRATGTAPSKGRAAAGAAHGERATEKEGRRIAPGASARERRRPPARARSARGRRRRCNHSPRSSPPRALGGRRRRAPRRSMRPRRAPPALPRRGRRGDRGGLREPRSHARPPSAGIAQKAPGQMRLLKAEELKSRPHGTPARAAGLVTCRQCPTPRAAWYSSLEDETGCMNIVVWRHLVETQRRELLGARLMGVRAWSSATARSCTWSPGAFWTTAHCSVRSQPRRAISTKMGALAEILRLIGSYRSGGPSTDRPSSTRCSAGWRCARGRADRGAHLGRLDAPSAPPRALDLATGDIAARRYDIAETRLTLLLRRAPDFAEAWHKRALYYLLGRDDECLHDMRRTSSSSRVTSARCCTSRNSALGARRDDAVSRCAPRARFIRICQFPTEHGDGGARGPNYIPP